MPDQDLSGFSRVCPSCGRRVPRNVATCRCGVELPVDRSPAVPVAEAEDTSGGSTVLVAIVAGRAPRGGAGYWMFVRRAPAATDAATAATAEPEAHGRRAERAPRASPEARAWDAAASANGRSRAGAPNAPRRAAGRRRRRSPLPASIEDMVDRVMPAVVLIETTSGRGSGFFVRHDTLITNVHVVQNDSYVTLRRMDGSSVNARVESKAPAFDLAILKVATPSRVASGDPDGQRALAQARPGDHRDWLRARHAAEQRLARHRQRPAHRRRRDAGADRRRRPIPATAAGRCSIATAR